MTIGATGGRGKQVRLPWKQVPRKTAHRTSEPTNDAVERAIAETILLGSGKPVADTVIFAALRFSMRKDLAGFVDEVRAVEAGMYTVWRPMGTHDPGE